MPGFLLQDDAISARKQQFDDWADEQRRAAEQAARQVQQQAQQVAQQQSSEVAARATQFQDWVSQQTAQQQPTAPAAPAPAPVPSLPATPAVEPAAAPPALGEAPDVAARAKQFQDWVTQSAQQAAQPAVPAPVQPQAEPSAAAPSAPPTPTGEPGWTRLAKEQLNKPYIWGSGSGAGGRGTGDIDPQTGLPKGFDCSGYVSWVMKEGLGVDVPAFTGTAYEKTQAISPDQAKAGDIVFYNMGNPDPHMQHMALYLGNGQIIQAGGTARNVNIADVNAVGAPQFRRAAGTEAADARDVVGSTLQGAQAGAPAGERGNLTPSRFQPSGAPMSKTTAELSGGGPASGMTERAQSIMSEAGQAAAAFGGDAAKAVQAVLVTEGGMNNARGDSGQSAGPLQFYGGGGQLNNFAKNLGVPLEDAKRWVEENPVAAVRWALGTPDAPGYLGRALVDGISKGLTGADLATHIQRTGQVSVSPERAGQNFLSLFGQGQDAVRTAGGGLVEGALEAGRQVAGRAGELVSQGQQLAESGARGAQDAWRELDTAQSRAHAESERWLAEQRARGEEWDAQRQRRDLDWQRNLDEGMRGFGERAQGFTAPVTQGFDQLASSPIGRAFEESPYNPIRDVVRTAQAIPENLGRLGQGVEAASREATRQESEQLGARLPVEAARFGAGLFGQQLPPELETGLRGLSSNAARGLESDPGGVVSAFLKSSGIASPEMTIDLPGLGAVPVADLVGLGANLMIPTGAEARFGRTALAGGAQTLGGDAASMAVSQVARWARAGVDDIAGELAQSPIGRTLSDDVLLDVAAQVKEALPDIQQLLRSRARGEAEVGFAIGMPTGGRTPQAAAGRNVQAEIADVNQWLRAQTPQQATARQVGQQEGPLTGGQHVANWISSNFLSGPGLVWNVLNQSGHLGWQPLQRTFEGHPVEALNAVRAAVASFPEALQGANRVITRGEPYAGVGGQQSRDIGKPLVGLRANLGGDAFMRILNERMGGMLEAQRQIRSSGAKTSEEIAAVIAQSSGPIAEAAAREGRVSALTTGQARSKPIRALSDAKQTLLTNKNPAAQALGVLLHVAVPFARVPEELLYQVTRNSPIIGNLIDAFQVVKAAPGDDRAAAASKAALNAAITGGILSAVAGGNVRGPDDLEHPNQVQVAGRWIPLTSLGTFGGRLSIAATVFDALNRESNEPSAGFEDRLDRAVNSVAKLGLEEYPLTSAMKMLTQITRGQFTGAATQFGSDLVSGMTPVSSALGGITNFTDPYTRQVERSGWRGTVEPTLARIPGLGAELLPQAINPATGQPDLRPSTGPASLLRIQNVPNPKVETELNDLNRKGFTAIKPPSKDLPKTLKVAGVDVKISTAQAQQIQAARGRMLAAYAGAIDTPGYQQMTDEQKALFWQRALARAGTVGESAADVTALQTENLEQQLRERRRIAGRLVAADRARG